jgi:hypothetical protein
MSKKEEDVKAELMRFKSTVMQKASYMIDKNRTLMQDYEGIYSLILAILGQAENNQIIIKKENRTMLAHQYRIFQKEEPKTGDLVLKRLSIYDDIE